jgi:hypothetical protein
VLSISIPNAAMGVQRALPGDGEKRTAVPAAEFFETLAFENRPIAADVPYATRLEDLTDHNRGWLEKAEAALFGAADVRTAAR